MEHSRVALILAFLLVCSTGCLDSPSSEPVQKTETPAPTTVPTAETTRPPAPPSDMALQISDMPSDYVLKDRSVMALPEVSQLTRELGWREGYFVSFYHMDKNINDITRIRQSISVFSPDTINGVFLLEKEELKHQVLSPATRYEIPFPAAGDQSIAFRDINPVDPERPVTYTVIFTKKNVFEKITMSGTNTDYETLKRLVHRAEALIG